MDYYKDDLDRPPRRLSRYPDDDYYDSEPFDKFDRDPYPGGDHFQMYPPPHPPPFPPPGGPMEPPSEPFIMSGSVAVEFKNPFDTKPSRRAKPSKCHTVFVGSLPDNCTETHLKDLFSKCGTVEDARISRGRNFGHVHFNQESSVERAMELSGATIRIENSFSPKDRNKIHVDYARDKAELDFQKRIKEEDMLPYSTGNVQTLSSEIHRDECFAFAAKTVVHWLSKGQLEESAASPLYNLVNSVNIYSRKLNKVIQTQDEEVFEYSMQRKVALKRLLAESEVILEVFESAPGSKLWVSFTKAQRKTINQWKEQAMELKERLMSKLQEEDRDREEPPRKIAKNNGNANLEADLERAEKEIEQLKTDREVAIEKKDKQILQLKTLMAKFKKSCPEEWEKALGVSSDEKKDSGKDSDRLSSDEEMIEGVSLDDLNKAMNKDASENSLASAAAAYAQMRKSVGSSETSGLSLSEPEVAIVAVLAAYLTVHPLGATIDAITAYFQNFNPSYNSYFLESLLRRLTKVFQLSNDKWWFLGFQTCYSTPTAASASDNQET